ncbi:hypothetical protein LCGC14_2121570, partial [marine sediment metagenome]
YSMQQLRAIKGVGTRGQCPLCHKRAKFKFHVVNNEGNYDHSEFRCAGCSLGFAKILEVKKQ